MHKLGLNAAHVPRAAKYVWHLQAGWGQAGQGVIDAADTFFAINGSSIGPDTASSWFKEVPWAFRKQLKWVSDRCGGHWAARNLCFHPFILASNVCLLSRPLMKCHCTVHGSHAEAECEPVLPRGRYSRPVMWVTENGVAEPNEANEALPGVLNDTYRIDFYRDYMQAAMAAVTQDNVRVSLHHLHRSSWNNLSCMRQVADKGSCAQS